MDFNKERFMSFGRYDLTINKAFYQTMLLITLFGSIGIASSGFFLRWFFCVQFGYPTDPIDDYSNLMANYHCTAFTTLALIVFTSIMYVLFFGCTFHNLRNKQGRITELTLPATNFEKFSWHLLFVIIAGFLAISASLICADIVNAILNLIIFPLDAQSSLTWSVIQGATAQGIDFGPSMEGRFTEIKSALGFMTICLTTSGHLFFVLGNAVKYKYNIILTYIVYEVSITIIVFSIVAYGVHTADEIPADFDSETGVIYLNLFMNIVAVINIGLTALYAWASYKLYKKAQITSGWNR